MTAYLITSSLLNFLAAVLLGFSVMFGSRRQQRNVSFGIFALSVGVWSAAYFMWQISRNADQAIFFCRLLVGGAIVIPITFFHFVTRVVGEARPVTVRAGYGISLALQALNLTPLLIEEVRPAMEFDFWPQAGPLFWVFLAHFFFFTGYAWVLMIRAARLREGAAARQIHYLFFASLTGFVGGSTNFPLWYGIPIPPLGNGLVFVYLAMMGHAISKYRLPMINVDLFRGLVYTCLGLTIAVFYLLVVAVVYNLLGDTITPAEILNHFLLSLIVMIFSIWGVPRLKDATEHWVEHTVMRGRYRHRARLKNLAQKIYSIREEDQIYSEAVESIAEALSLKWAAVLSRGELERGFVLRAAVGLDCPPGSVALADSDRLVLELEKRMQPLIWELEHEVSGETWRSLHLTRQQFPFDVALPILGENFLLGFLLLGPREQSRPFTEADLSLLEAVCIQIGVTVRSRQLERRANQTEKLISLGTLAAGLAHELRNPLVSIQTFTALWREKRDDVEFQNEFRTIMERDVSRIASIVENVAAFAENSVVAVAPLHLADVIEGVYEIVKPEIVRANIEFTLYRTRLSAVQGNFSQLLQVFLNLFQNAVHALQGREGPRLIVRLETIQREKAHAFVRVAVSDNGAGIDPALLPRVFDPFTTTKSTGEDAGKRGMGLGLAIVKRIVDSHHGAIEVNSEPGQGTTFHIYFPCLDPKS